jgi:hypothetical protein
MFPNIVLFFSILLFFYLVINYKEKFTLPSLGPLENINKLSDLLPIYNSDKIYPITTNINYLNDSISLNMYPKNIKKNKDGCILKKDYF